MISHVIADGSHQLLVEADHSCVTLQLLDVSIIESCVGTSCIGFILFFDDLVAPGATFTRFELRLSCWAQAQSFDLLEHFKHVNLLVNLSIL